MRVIKIMTVLVISSIGFFCCKTKNNTSGQQQAKEKQISANEKKFITSFEQWNQKFEPLVSAHRGGPYAGFPENAIETFQNIVNQTPTVIECDVSMTKDSVLVLMHDRNLDRTTTGEGAIKEATFTELQQLTLVDNDGNKTNFKIPTLDEVLAWGKGKVLFTLDVKRGVPYDKVIEAVEKHNAVSYAAVITYKIQDAVEVHKLNKNVIISVSAGSDGALEQIEKAELPVDKLLGFVGTRQPEKSHYEKLKKFGIRTILGTLGNLDKSAVAKGDDNVYLTYIENGANIIATDRPLEVAKVLAEAKK